MANEILGRGWAFPILPDAAGRLQYVEGEQDIEQALRIVLLTRVSERPMRPAFGSAVASYLFAPGSVKYLGLLEGAVREAIRDWEPRVELLDASAVADAETPSLVTVSIDYRVRRTNNRANLVFPFYLMGGGV
jgi:phage baseplate assembly protein W